jgi:hypothetical protein
MKKPTRMLLSLGVMGTILSLLSAFSLASNVDEAVSWAHDQGLTIYTDASSFKQNFALRRDEAAKFYVTFAKSLGKTEYVVPASQCQFSDLDKAWSDLRAVVVESCRLGIFKGTNGRFRPSENLTDAQAVAVLMRIVDGQQSEVGGSHRADNYYKRANALDILQGIDMTQKNALAARGNVVSVIYNAKDVKS